MNFPSLRACLSYSRRLPFCVGLRKIVRAICTWCHLPPNSESFPNSSYSTTGANAGVHNWPEKDIRTRIRFRVSLCIYCQPIGVKAETRNVCEVVGPSLVGVYPARHFRSHEHNSTLTVNRWYGQVDTRDFMIFTRSSGHAAHI